MEIERKYLLKQLPSNLDSYASKKIAQGYLCTSPVVRVRRSNDSYYMTYKGAGLMVREEYNLPLTKEAYDHLVQKIDGRLIEKTRYLIPLDGGLTAELDVFEGDLAPISAGGATTMDTTLPIITRCSGQQFVVVSIFHGFMTDFSVPFLVTFFCSI